MKESEQELIFKEWLRLHKGLLFKITRAYAFSIEDRDDLFQEISLQIWRSIPNFRAESAVTTWLYRISLNTAMRWKGQEQKYTKSTASADHPMPVLREEEGASDEQVEWLYQEIGKLNEIDRSICLLLFDDYSHREIGDILGVSENNVAVKIHRIKKHLTQQSKNTRP